MCVCIYIYFTSSDPLLRAVAWQSSDIWNFIVPRGLKDDLTSEQITIDNKHVQNLFTYPCN